MCTCVVTSWSPEWTGSSLDAGSISLGTIISSDLSPPAWGPVVTTKNSLLNESVKERINTLWDAPGDTPGVLGIHKATE